MSERAWQACGRGICAAEAGHEWTCAEASGWTDYRPGDRVIRTDADWGEGVVLRGDLHDSRVQFGDVRDGLSSLVAWVPNDKLAPVEDEQEAGGLR